MYCRGKIFSEKLSLELLSEIVSGCTKHKVPFDQVTVESIIEVLDRCSKLWFKGSNYYTKALFALEAQGSFSLELNEDSLSIMSELLKRESLEQRVIGELGGHDVLDGFVEKEGYKGRVHFAALGTLLHITAGNVFLGAIDSILLGLLTKNTSLVKLSSTNKIIPYLFMESLLEADTNQILFDKIFLLEWKGGNLEVENFLKKEVDGIIAWGGEEMSSSYRKDLSPRVRFIEHGPKISFHVISLNYYKSMSAKEFDALALDISMWDQQACSNSQNIFIDSKIDKESFISKVASSLESAKSKNHILTADELVEKVKEKERAQFLEFQTGVKPHLSATASVFFGEGLKLSPTALNRSVKVMAYNGLDELTESLKAYSYYLQTCGLGVISSERERFLSSLSGCGLSRFTRCGEMMSSLSGSPHDGSFPLTELTRIVCDELISRPTEYALDSVISVPFYHEKDISSFDNLPLIDGATLAENTSSFISTKAQTGIVFSSGGTSGKPKYAFYSDREFKEISQILGESYRKLGLRKGVKVANLFVAGNMWSSFIAVQQALSFCDVIQYPIGGLVSSSEFLKLVQRFEINILFGLPSLLVRLASECPNLQIDSLFYAGESFSVEQRRFVEKQWGVKSIYSAGYASVDVGPIGYQDKTCKGDEHILFDEFIHMEIIDEEAVVTSKYRKNQPVVRYRTGDKVERIAGNRFRLLGRIDNLVFIWASRISLDDLKRAIGCDNFQLELSTEKVQGVLCDKLSIHLNSEYQENELERMQKEVYKLCDDLNRTVSFDFFKDNMSFKDGLLENSKTGKVKQVFDLR